MADPKEYDGFYFLPGDEENELNLAYFQFKEEFGNAEPIETTPMGDKYHIAFFKRGEDGNPEFDDSFEAIFADPTVYIKGLIGAEVYGCVLRKTEKSQKWFDEYLNRAKKTVMMAKMTGMLKSIAESK
jgi:hypothetical protein